MVDQLYQGVLSRKATKSEQFEGVNLLRNTGQLKPLIRKLKNLDEFKRLSLHIAAPEIVKATYKGVLNRNPDEKDLKRHIGTLQKDGGTEGFIISIINSSEFEHRKKTTLAAPQLSEAVVPRGPMQGRLVIVSSNCQTGGIAAALQVCFPKDQVVPLPVPDISNLDIVRRFIRNLKDADVWVSTFDMAWANDNGFEPCSGFHHIKIPSLVFPAFHPDLCYAINLHNSKYTKGHYNSAIAVWAYNRGLTTTNTIMMYNRENYRNLGYFEFWNPSVESLRQSFTDCGLDFPCFMLAIKRTGLFMHTINHPMIHALIGLAKLVSLKMGGSETIFEKDIKINDALISHPIWPLYPEIADEFALPYGSYDWKIGGKHLLGIEQYLEYAFDNYENQKIQRGFLKMASRDEEIYNRILGPQLDLMS